MFLFVKHFWNVGNGISVGNSRGVCGILHLLEACCLNFRMQTNIEVVCKNMEGFRELCMSQNRTIHIYIYEKHSLSICQGRGKAQSLGLEL